MSAHPLSTAKSVDLASVELDYEGFRALAQNPNLNAHEKIGFPSSYREGFEAAILADICAKLPILTQGERRTVVDIGPGCGPLAKSVVELCVQRRHRLVLVDSPEMLAHLPDVPGVTVKQPGLFPDNAVEVAKAAGRGVDALICYSVLHYIFVDSNPFDFVDRTVELLAPGGAALIGDIPNVSKRNRFFASQAGQAFHRAFTGKEEPYVVDFNAPTPGKIDDAVLMGLIQRARGGGCDAYLMPQAADLPMANRREDLLLVRH
ncbi:MAG TPA: class I SAM-dependent methyltransferase [Caulobacteraceae bacterium]|nr:class I SAM-dependent methyltransferase [Caulobacteraceae bacterium]